MLTITDVLAREILDSRGDPTLETRVQLSDASEGIASVPSGASKGIYEAQELRDNDPARFGGMGVLKAVSNINTLIAAQVKGHDPIQQGKIDELLINLDATNDKSKLGANTLLSVSLAVCKAAANAAKLPLYSYIATLLWGEANRKISRLPTPLFNIINGGKHGAGNLEFQEFQIIPATNKKFSESLQIGVEVYHRLREVLVQRNATYSVGDEGGYAPNLRTNSDALEAIMEAIRATRYKFGFEIFLGLDIAASHFKRDDHYFIKEHPTPLDPEEFIGFLVNLHHDYRLLAMEDPLAEDDWQGWRKLGEVIGREVLIVGDDLIATNRDRLQQAISQKACSAVIVKPNQIGTLSETLSVVKLAKQHDIKIVVSHRSGETNDAFIADFGVGIGADYVKFGAPARGERVAKYNRMLEISASLRL